MMVRGRILMEGRAMRLYGWKDPAHSLIEALNPESRRCLPRTKKGQKGCEGMVLKREMPRPGQGTRPGKRTKEK
jgi:hypothetical protein